MEKVKYKVKKIQAKTKSKNNNKKYSEELYEKAFGRKIDWENPTEFNEKLMCLKVFNYNNNDLVKKCADKYGMREFIKEKGVKEKHLSDLLGVFDDCKEINESELPDKFVIKCTHGEYLNIVCLDKDNFDFKSAFAQISKWQKENYGYETGELQYLNIRPRIIIEKIDDYLYDYKLYCFNGKPKVILVTSRYEKDLKLSFYDLNFKKLNLESSEYKTNVEYKAPRYLKDMIGIAKKVSSDFPFVRINFHEENGKAILDEMVFTPSACLATYYSPEGNKYLSDLLKIEKM